MATEWVKLTEQGRKEGAEANIWVNLTNASIITEHKGGSRIWFAGDTKNATTDVKESPDEVLRKAGQV